MVLTKPEHNHLFSCGKKKNNNCHVGSCLHMKQTNKIKQTKKVKE
jgi:hypothetical protein